MKKQPKEPLEMITLISSSYLPTYLTSQNVLIDEHEVFRTHQRLVAAETGSKDDKPGPHWRSSLFWVPGCHVELYEFELEYQVCYSLRLDFKGVSWLDLSE